MKEFCQTSKNGLCRLDAICNAIGYSFITPKQFNQKCDEFDKKHDNQIGFSREFFSVVKESYDNIFNYILSEHDIITKYIDDSLQKEVY